MNNQPRLYIAATGMMTAVGRNTAMTAAAVNAGVSAYVVSEYFNKNYKPVTVAEVPAEIFIEQELDASFGHHRINPMAFHAIREVCEISPIEKPTPLILAMPEAQAEFNKDSTALMNYLMQHCQPWASPKFTRSIHSGRAAGIDAIEFAFNYLADLQSDYIMIGGSDTHCNHERLDQLDKDDRLLAETNPDGFAPGEGAGFLLLTRHPQLALVRNGNLIALHAPGTANESGHLYSDKVYSGEGLDQAFKKALLNYSQAGGDRAKIHSIYSSMNGENHWAKEFGVALLRNKPAFQQDVSIQHPADCYGDLGAATAPVLIGLAAESLFKHANASSHLIYSSSDHGRRGAIVIEKMAASSIAVI